MSIIDIGYILLDTINSKTDLNKIKLINAIETYKKRINDKKENEINNRNRYITNYENKRKKNEDNYNLLDMTIGEARNMPEFETLFHKNCNSFLGCCSLIK